MGPRGGMEVFDCFGGILGMGGVGDVRPDMAAVRVETLTLFEFAGPFLSAVTGSGMADPDNMADSDPLPESAQALTEYGLTVRSVDGKGKG